MRYILLILAVIIPNIVYGATYTNTLLKDIVTTDPAENCLPSEYNDAERETRLIMTYTKGMGSSTVSKTLTGTQTFHFGSSTTTITLPAASTIASATVGKEFVLHNTGAGTITVSVPMLNNTAGTITLSGNQSAYLFSDNVSYYQLRNSTEYNHIADSTDPHGETLTQTNLIATNGTITTFAATTANISSTLTVNGVSGLVDGDIPNTITLDNITQITNRAHDSITGTGTYSHTSIDSHIDDTSDPHGATLTQTNATIAGISAPYIAQTNGTGTGITLATATITTGTATTLYNTTFSGNVGTFTGTLGVNGISGIVDNDIPGTITLDAITQITSRAHDDITGTGTNSHSTIDTHLADTSDPHGASMTQTNISVTTGTVTTLYNTTFSGSVGTFTGKLGVNGISGVVDDDIPDDINITKAVTSWASGGTTGTGTMYLAAGSGMSLTPSYNSNGIGTITFTAAGTASAGGWTLGGTQTVTESSTKYGGVLNLNSNWISGDDNAEGIYIATNGYAAVGTTTPLTEWHVIGSITVSGNVDGRDISADGTTLDSHTADTTDPHGASLTQTNISVTTGTVTTMYGTTITIGGTVTADSFVGDGSGLTGLTNSWASLTGVPTDNGSVSVTSAAGYIPAAGSDGKLDYSWQKDVIRLTGTTTEQAAGAYGQLYVQSSGASNGGPQNAVLLLHGDGADTSTVITNSTDSGITMSAVGNAQIDTAQSVFGGASILFDGTTDYIAGSDTASVLMNQDFELDMRVRFNSVATSQNLYYHNTNGNNLCCLQHHIGSGALRFFVDVGGGGVMSISHPWSPSTGIWYAIRVALDASENTYYLWVDGSLVKTVIDTDKPADYSNDFYFGRGSTAGESNLDGWLDEILLKTGTGSIQTTGTYTVAGGPYSYNYTQYSAKYLDPVNGNTVFEILTSGTVTTNASYIYCNATTTVFGLGTNTAITGTTTAYSGWFDGAVRATAYNVASTEKIKENIKPIKIKPEILVAEAVAKEKYKGDNRIAWIATYGENYTYVGSDTAIYVDTKAMEADYANYIELAWASDLNQDSYVDAVQKAQEKYFWQMFDGIQPKSWNPMGDSSIERKGFVVGEMPDVVKGNDKESIDPMALIAYIAVSMQSIKQDNVTIMQALRDFATTGTFTVSTIEDRLDVLETTP